MQISQNGYKKKIQALYWWWNKEKTLRHITQIYEKKQ